VIRLHSFVSNSGVPYCFEETDIIVSTSKSTGDSVLKFAIVKKAWMMSMRQQ